jgi:UDP-glucose 4-epimerase
VRVVIFGATGNSGTSLLQALEHESAVTEIVGVARRVPEISFPKTTWCAADIAEDDLDPIVRGADVVVHLAWAIQPSHDPDLLDRINLLGSTCVFEAVVSQKVPALVYASSVGAYSPGAGPVVEDWPTDGIESNLYSQQKATVERDLDRFERDNRDIRVVRIRPSLIFKRDAASHIRRLFTGPFLPTTVISPKRTPMVPDIPGLVSQCVHADDLADAYRRVIVDDSARGAYNVTTEPPLTAEKVAEALDCPTVSVSRKVAHMTAAAMWHAHLQPTHPSWLDLGIDSPLMSSTRIRTELGWRPTRDSIECVTELMQGMHDNAGMATPPLDPDAGGPGRIKEFATGIGERT